MLTPQAPRSWPSRLLFELPWLLAVTISAGLLLAAVPQLDHPWGSNWPHYFESAHFFWDPTSVYFEWRTPMYPLLLASLGKPLGYAAAGHLIAKTSAVLLVLSAGLLGRAWQGPAAGAIAALGVPMLQCAVESASWTNMYPLAAAACALAIATGAWLARKPRLGTALLGGLLAGLAWKLNHLGLVTIPMVGGLLLIGLSRPQTGLRRALLIGLFGLGVGSAHGLNLWIVQHWSVPQGDLSTQVVQRRREELERIQANPEDKFSACTDLEPKPLNLPELTNACALQFVDSNYGTLQAEDCAPPPKLLLFLLPLALLPGSRARDWGERLRTSAASALLIGGMAGAVYLGAAWTSYSEKYILAFLPILLAMGPVGLARLGNLLGRRAGRARWGTTAGLVGAGLLAASTWPQPTGLHADAPKLDSGWERTSGKAAAWAQSTVTQDDLLLDCVPLRVDLAMLPMTVPSRFGIGTQQPCSGWIKTPPSAPGGGQVYMLTRTFAELPHTAPQSISAAGWRRLGSFEGGHHLWVRQPQPR
jgi:hypothetical protein